MSRNDHGSFSPVYLNPPMARIEPNYQPPTSNIRAQHQSYQQPTSKNPHSHPSLYSPIPQTTRTPPHSKMMVMHRPEVYSGNQTKSCMYKHSNKTLNNFDNSTLSPIASRQQSHNFRNTQGYNLSQTQNAQYQKDKNSQKSATCCFCFK